MKTYTFHINGMHCNACVLLTEEEISKARGVQSVRSDLRTHTALVTGEWGGESEADIAQELSKTIEPHGYSLSPEKQKHDKKLKEFLTAGPIALLFIAGFFLLQKSGLVNLIGGGNVTYGTAFVIGIIASLSTCMAVVGGLLLSMSATFAKEGDKVRPQLFFHVGRLFSFFILGGVIGVAGSAFTLNTTTTIALSVVIGLVMLVLGINLLDVFPWFKKLQPSMPRFISKHTMEISSFNHTFTPFLVGIATFFLPCGFTQSMQLYTLTTSTFVRGGLTMLSFALGTLPVLALLSFSSFSIHKSSKAGVFFKTAGLIVIVFALFNLLTSLVVAGIMPPLLNF